MNNEHQLSFQEITAAVKKQCPESLKLHFRAYDIVSEESQEKRLDMVQEIVYGISSPNIFMVETSSTCNEADVLAAHNTYVQRGYEGAMLRLPNGKYEQGARSRSLLKVKEFNEGEFEFVRWEQGQREEDLLAVLNCVTGILGDTKVKEFRAKMEGNRKEKEEMRKQKPKKITVKHFNFTSDGLPRFPIGKCIRDYE